MKTSLLTTGRFAIALFSVIVFSSGCAAQGTLQEALNKTNQATQAPTTAPTTTNKNINAAVLADPAKANLKAPDTFKVKFTTSKGEFVLQINRAWSPNGADRFYNMVKAGFFNDEIVIFRAIQGFMFQFRIHGDPAIAQKWSDATIMDDPNANQSNLPGTICFAKTGLPNSRSTQIFINLGNNAGLDRQGFTPFGKVVTGMDVVGKIYTGYGENKPSDNVQGNFKQKGNAYIKAKFPSCDSITSATIVE